jgi:hypothetical protein
VGGVVVKPNAGSTDVCAAAVPEGVFLAAASWDVRLELVNAGPGHGPDPCPAPGTTSTDQSGAPEIGPRYRLRQRSFVNERAEVDFGGARPA